MDERERRRRYMRCSFCGKGQDQVRKLVAGPGDVSICDLCISLCNEVLEEDAHFGGSKGRSVGTTPRVGTKAGSWKRVLGWRWRRWRVTVART
jgi:hypothetical protein